MVLQTMALQNRIFQNIEFYCDVYEELGGYWVKCVDIVEGTCIENKDSDGTEKMMGRVRGEDNDYILFGTNCKQKGSQVDRSLSLL